MLLCTSGPVDVSVIRSIFSRHGNSATIAQEAFQATLVEVTQAAGISLEDAVTNLTEAVRVCQVMAMEEEKRFRTDRPHTSMDSEPSLRFMQIPAAGVRSSLPGSPRTMEPGGMELMSLSADTTLHTLMGDCSRLQVCKLTNSR